jgi:C1A family cysteine protease
MGFYGRLKDEPHNHPKFSVKHFTVPPNILPMSVDLRLTGFVPPVLDQKSLGSCVANATSNALRFCLYKQKCSRNFQPSRLVIYYYGRKLDGSDPNDDCGMTTASACKAIKQFGACSEQNWSYNISKFSIEPAKGPMVASSTHTASFKCLSVFQDLIHIKQILNSGFPIVFGMQVYSSFESEEVANTGIVNLPDSTETNLGGHCILLVAYNNDTQRFTCQNSWGLHWGQGGFFTIPYSYVLNPNLAEDFWCILSYK